MAKTSPGKEPMEKRAAQRISPWVSYSSKEVEDIVIKLAKQGTQSNKIGLALRDQYGIPSVKVSAGKSLTKILKEGSIYPNIPEDMFNLLKRAVNIRFHLEKNKKDYTSHRGLEIVESKIRRLAKYYKSSKVLPVDWKYDPERARLIVK